MRGDAQGELFEKKFPLDPSKTFKKIGLNRLVWFKPIFYLFRFLFCDFL